ncbi:MAG: rhodanese-like domain-containing protein [Ignavibacteria bacterium]|nr:rhodanese-like domain-containing protein [Ignavibacteria bacterium]
MTKFLIAISFLLALLSVPACDYFFPPLKGDKIPVNEAYNYLKKHSGDKDVVLLDVRTKEEYDRSHLQNAVNIDYSSTDFPDNIEKLDKNLRYIIYENSDKKSSNTFMLMKELRFPNAHYIIGGFDEWKKENLPVKF